MRTIPVFTGLAIISRELFSALDGRQREILNVCNINIVIMSLIRKQLTKLLLEINTYVS